MTNPDTEDLLKNPDGCSTALELAALLSDGSDETVVTEDELIFFNGHIADCPDCSFIFSQLKQLRGELQNLPELELPYGFHEQAMQNIKVLRRVSFFGRNKINFQKFAKATAAAACAVVIISAAGVGLSELDNGINNNPVHDKTTVILGTNDTGNVLQDSETGGSAVAEYYSEQPSSGDDLTNSVKIAPFSAPAAAERSSALTVLSEKNVVQYSIVLEVADLDEAMYTLSNSAGYTVKTNIEQWNENDRQAYIVRSVENAYYDDAIYTLRELGEVVTEQRTLSSVAIDAQDFNTFYFVKAEEMSRLLTLLETSSTVSDMLTVERRIDIVSTDLDYYKTKANYYENISNAAVLNITLTEKEDISVKSRETFTKRIVNSFNASTAFVKTLTEEIMVVFSYVFLPALIIAFLFFTFKGFKTIIKRWYGDINSDK